MQRSRYIYVALIACVVVLAVSVLFLLQSTRADRGTLITRITITEPADDHYTITVSSIELWNAERGWRTIDQRARVLSTQLEDTARSFIHLETPLPARTYDRIRVGIDRIDRVREEHETEVVPMLVDTITLTAPIRIERRSSQALLLTLPLADSLYATNTRTKVFVPRIHLESRSGVSVSGDQFSGGNIHANATFGMSADGSMRMNYRLPKDTTFTLEHGRPSVTSLPTPLSPVERLELEIAEEAQSTPELLNAQEVEEQEDIEIDGAEDLQGQEDAEREDVDTEREQSGTL